jgi:hypothetical protein
MHTGSTHRMWDLIFWCEPNSVICVWADFHFTTEKVGSGGKDPHLCSRESRFVFRPFHRLQCLFLNAGAISQTRIWQIPSTRITIHYSVIILQLDATYSGVQTASLNKLTLRSWVIEKRQVAQPLKNSNILRNLWPTSKILHAFNSRLYALYYLPLSPPLTSFL